MPFKKARRKCITVTTENNIPVNWNNGESQKNKNKKKPTKKRKKMSKQRMK